MIEDTIINGVHLMLCAITFFLGLILGLILGYVEGEEKGRAARPRGGQNPGGEE